MPMQKPLLCKDNSIMSEVQEVLYHIFRSQQENLSLFAQLLCGIFGVMMVLIHFGS